VQCRVASRECFLLKLPCMPAAPGRLALRPAAALPYSQVLLCWGAAVGLLGCAIDDGSMQPASVPVPAPATDPTPQGAAAGTCMGAQAAGPWMNRSFGAQTGKVAIEFSATPSAAAIDAVVGFSRDAAAQLGDLAAAIRFQPDGTIAVRAGSEYRSDLGAHYTAGTTYRFHVVLDVAAHTYSVQLASAGSAASASAASYGFGAAQASVTQLTNLGVSVDSTAGGLQICDVQIAPDALGGCDAAVAGAAVHNRAIGQPGEVVVTMETAATPTSVLDGVIGLSPDRATSVDDLAAQLRFSPAGVIDARDGDRYRADAVVTYTPGEARRIRIIANVATRTFSAFVATSAGASVQIAHHYAFAASSKAAYLGNIGSVVGSAAGTLATCSVDHQISVGVRSLREGNFDVAPLPADEAIVSSATTTLHVTRAGGVVAQLAAGGRVAADPSGNVYLARITGGTLVVEAYTPALARRWSHALAVGADQQVVAIGADAGSVVAATGPMGGGVTLAKRWLADGTGSTALTGLSADAIAVGPAGLVLGNADGTTVTLRKFALGGTEPTWKRSFENSARIAALALSPGGTVAFAGTFDGPISFGGEVVQPGVGGKVYAATLTSAGDAGFVRPLGDLASVAGIAVNGGLVAISGAGATSGDKRLTNLEADNGAEIDGENERDPFNFTAGTAGPVAVGAAGQVFWNVLDAWPAGSSYPYLVSLQPGV